MVNKFNKRNEVSLLTKTLQNKKTLQDEPSKNFKVSFQYLDCTQKYASGFKDWQKFGLLSKALEVLQGYCCGPLLTQVDGSKFTIYGDFPEKNRTYFQHPKHVPEDASWGRIHITGVAILAGHIVGDTFYVVFLDKSHKFFLTKRAAGIK